MFKYVLVLLLAVSLTACSHDGHDHGEGMMDKAMDGVKDMGEAVKDTAEGAVDVVKDAGEAVVDTTKDVAEGAVDIAKDAGEAVVDTAKDAGEAVKEGAEKMMDDEKEVKEETGSAARYEAYSAQTADGQKHAVFFHASWCGKCKKLDESLQGSVGAMPEGALVFKADYDSAEDLKKKYGVVSQDTVVFINADGSVAKLTMGATADQVSEFFQS